MLRHYDHGEIHRGNYKQYCMKFVREVFVDESFAHSFDSSTLYPRFEFCTLKKNHEGNCKHDYLITIETGIAQKHFYV